jgi:hypothetical protein
MARNGKRAVTVEADEEEEKEDDDEDKSCMDMEDN